MTAETPNALKDRNLDLFRRVAPEIHRRLAALPGGAGEAAAKADEGPRFNTRFTLQAPEPWRLDLHTYPFLIDTLERAKAAGIRFFDAPRTEEAFFLVVIGAATTESVLNAIERTRAEAVFIVEPGREALARGLGRVDWTKVLERARAGGGEVHFILEDDPDRVSGALWRAMRGIDPAAADGMTIAVQDHAAFARAVVDNLGREGQLIVAQLGFFHDETLMIANTYRNLTREGGRLFKAHGGIDAGLAAIVVGSGPSLDWSMDHIHRLRDRAVVISAGSALRPLIKNGITPDFQIEIENIEVSPLTRQVAAEHDLSAVTLVAAASLDTDAVQGFGDIVHFFRQALSPYPLFADGPARLLPLPDPTVVNAALSFAHETGFGDIYLFGTDLGSQWPDRHHAKDTFHYSDASTHRHRGYDIEIEANFGGTCFTDRGLYAARDNVVAAIGRQGGSRRHFNCSDGVALPGAEPMMPDAVAIDAPATPKADAVAAILARFEPLDAAATGAAWSGADLARESDAFAGALGDALKGISDFTDPAHRRPLLALLRPGLGDSVTPRPGAADAAVMVYRGTVMAMLVFFQYYLARVADPAEARPFAAIARDALIQRLGVMATLARDAFSGPEPLPPPHPEIWSPGTDERLPEPLAIPRNAGCPCGSGRKFKQCHGKPA